MDELKLTHQVLSQTILENIAERYADKDIFTVDIHGNYTTFRHVSGYEKFRYVFEEPNDEHKHHVLCYISNCGVKIRFFYDRLQEDSILING